MKICHVCSAEQEDSTDFCTVCGAQLTDADVADSAFEEAEPDEIILKSPVLVAQIEDVVSAEIFRDILKENGILYTCGEDEGGYMRIGFGGVSYVAEEIYVEESDFERANALYEDFLNSEAVFSDEFDGELPEDDLQSEEEDSDEAGEADGESGDEEPEE